MPGAQSVPTRAKHRRRVNSAQGLSLGISKPSQFRRHGQVMVVNSCRRQKAWATSLPVLALGIALSSSRSYPSLFHPRVLTPATPRLGCLSLQVCRLWPCVPAAFEQGVMSCPSFLTDHSGQGDGSLPTPQRPGRQWLKKRRQS